MKTRIIYNIIFIFLCSIFLLAALRGLPGNPTAEQLNTRTWKESGPLELSPERGRFGLLYSLIENRSLYFTTDLARFVTPAIGCGTTKVR